MADDYIFGPISTDNPQYDKALPYANSWLVKGNAQRLPYGETITISRGELHPMIEQTMLEDLEARRQASQAKAEPKQPEKPKKGRKASGRWGMLNDFCDIGPRYYTTAECWLWMVMFRGADGNSNRIKFGVRSLAEKAGVDKNTADKAVRKFVKDGLLVCVYKSRRSGTPSEYRLTDAVADLTKNPKKPS